MRNILRTVWFYVEDIVLLVLFAVGAAVTMAIAAIVADLVGSVWAVPVVMVLILHFVLGW